MSRSFVPWIVGLVIFGAVIVAADPTLADKRYPCTVVPANGSPVTITSCEAWARDWNKTVLTAHAAIGNYLFDLGVSLTNLSNKTVTGVRVKMTSYDSFNAVLGTINLDTASNSAANGMSIAPRSSFDLLGPKSWHGRNGNTDRDHVTVEVTAGEFSDGSIWTAPTPAPLPSASP